MKKRPLILVVLVILMIAFVVRVFWKHENAVYRTDISELSGDPDWTRLQQINSPIDAAEFQQKLEQYFVVDFVY